jgi:N-acylneuraminate cytidylyltransferase
MNFVAIIPVRKGSQRIKNKNLRPFANSCLLEIKIISLLQVPEIDDIVINTDSDDAINIAKKYNIRYHKRNEYYASSECINSDFWQHIAENTNGKVLILANCTAPLIKPTTISKMIQIYKNNVLYNNRYDSVVTGIPIKQHLWLDGKPLNYDYSNTPNTQNLPNIISITYGLCIISKQKQIKNRNVVGANPYLYILNEVEAVDIDNPIDFKFAEYLYRNNGRLLE